MSFSYGKRLLFIYYGMNFALIMNDIICLLQFTVLYLHEGMQIFSHNA